MRWLLAIALFVFVSAGLCYWQATRPPAVPQPIQETWLPGVVHICEVRKTPRPLVLHFVRINLATPGLKFIVTPRDTSGELPYKARTTTQFCRQFGALVAINGDFFYPWHSNTLWDYYPHVGDPVKALGFTASSGVFSGHWPPDSPTLFLSRDNHATIHQPQGSVYNAISGNAMLLERGQTVGAPAWYKDHADLHPRCTVGIDKAGKTLWLGVLDGRQKGYSEGASFQEWAEILKARGLYQAINLDGGGSAALAGPGRNSETKIVNSPIDLHFPGRERAVANHLGLAVKN